MRTSAGHFFRYLIPIAWDKLPERIRSSSNLSKFKLQLFSWLEKD